jgi:hypothetical protein
MPTQSYLTIGYRARRLRPTALAALATALLLTLLPASVTSAAEPPEPAKLLAGDAAADDRFGAAVAVDGDTALVGAPRGDGACPSDPSCNSGAAYLFLRGADGAWAQSAKLTPNDASAGDNFGAAVALSGDTALVGAYGNGDKGATSGSAYVFQRTEDGAWNQAAKLVPGEGAAGDWFGYSLALEGDTALVGAFLDGADGAYSGAAYIFERQSDGRWTEVTKLAASDGAAGDWFGTAVALSGDTVLVGAPGAASSGSQSGAAYLFEPGTDGAWSQVARIAASDGAVDAWFGTAVALEGDTALVGASGDPASGFHAGAAYFFQRGAGGTWTEQAKLLDVDGAAGDYFGEAVALSGDLALIGASGDHLVCASDRSCYSGSAYLFQRQEDGAWVQAARLEATDGAAGDWFGAQVALSGRDALVGARGTDEACPSDPYCDSGSANVYHLEGAVTGTPTTTVDGP